MTTHSIFPNISCSDDLLPFVQQNTQIRIKPCEVTGHTTVCYMVQDEDTFSGEHEHYERECRGITFSPDGSISSRSMHKFFNIGQREDVSPQNIRWEDVDRIMEKRDGSMITPVLTSAGVVKCKTKKSFNTKEAALADELLLVGNDRLSWVLNILQKGFTPTFEITTPKYPIVVLYKEDELTLLHIRENVSGRYFTEAEILLTQPPFPIVTNQKHIFEDGSHIVSWENLKKYAEETTGTEGLVIQFQNGDMVKLKTKWYSDLHHAVTFTRWRDIARAVIADTSDDLKGAFTLTGRSIDPIVKVENAISSCIFSIQSQVESHVQNGLLLNRTQKDMALALRDNQFFSLIMRGYRGQEVNYMEFYEKNCLDIDWSLEVVGEH